MNKFSKAAMYKFIIPKISCTYIQQNEQSKKEIKKIIPNIKISKLMKYLVKNLTNDAKDLYNENYKTLLKVEAQINRKTLNNV